jgi:CRISPR/Cas system endoribonuclease Cas6 (RAMP superfamily)
MSKQEEDYLGDYPDEIKEIMQAKGIHRDILEVRNLKAITELCVKTTKNLKYQNLTNLIYAIVGSLITFGITTYYQNKLSENNKTTNVTSQQFKQYKDSVQFEVNKLQTELHKLKTPSNLKESK